MIDEKFNHYLSLREKAKLHPTSIGFDVDDWFGDFLKDKPTQQQFEKLADDAYLSARLFWHLWSTR